MQSRGEQGRAQGPAGWHRSAVWASSDRGRREGGSHGFPHSLCPSLPCPSLQAASSFPPGPLPCPPVQLPGQLSLNHFASNLKFAQGWAHSKLTPFPPGALTYAKEGTKERRGRQAAQRPLRTPNFPPLGATCPLLRGEGVGWEEGEKIITPQPLTCLASGSVINNPVPPARSVSRSS